MIGLVGMLAGAKAKLLAAAAAVVAIVAVVAGIFMKGQSAGRQQADAKHRKQADDATERKDQVRDPGDRGTADKLRDGRF